MVVWCLGFVVVVFCFVLMKKPTSSVPCVLCLPVSQPLKA